MENFNLIKFILNKKIYTITYVFFNKINNFQHTPIKLINEIAYNKKKVLLTSVKDKFACSVYYIYSFPFLCKHVLNLFWSTIFVVNLIFTKESIFWLALDCTARKKHNFIFCNQNSYPKSKNFKKSLLHVSVWSNIRIKSAKNITLYVMLNRFCVKKKPVLPF